ncbi:MAG: lipoyl synthase [Deltaproteobacteria bacterium]|nr:lipoyl synthase [Deltaproteobacteria bacterium]
MPLEKLSRPKKPEWLKVRLPGGPGYERVRDLLSRLKLNTVCAESRCPNLGECWAGGTATVMLMGDVCTRGCKFCHVKSGKPLPLDADEPRHLAEAVSQLDLKYLVVTSVDRDDLPDAGAGHFAAAIRELRAQSPNTKVEVLIPDFDGVPARLDLVGNAAPHVIAQNLETVERLTHPVRDRRAGYRKTLDVLRYFKEQFPAIYTKSSLMVGLGETEDELYAAMRDLRDAGVDVLTLGQYLQPSPWNLKVAEYVHPDTFKRHGDHALSLGFLYCASGPLVRSSYRAAEFFMKGLMETRHHPPRQPAPR